MQGLALDMDLDKAESALHTDVRKIKTLVMTILPRYLTR